MRRLKLATQNKSFQTFGDPRVTDVVNDKRFLESKIGRTKNIKKTSEIQTFGGPRKTPKENFTDSQPVQTLLPSNLNTGVVTKNTPVISTEVTPSRVVIDKPVIQVSNEVNDQMINAYTSPEIVTMPRPKSETMSQVKKVAVGFLVTTGLSLLIKNLI